MVIRITRPDGSVSYQLRPHIPRGSAKYVGMKGSGGDVHVAAASVDDLDDPRVPLAFTESPVKAEALSRPWSCGTRVCAIGCFGVYGWRGRNHKGGKEVSPHLNYEGIVWVGVDAGDHEFKRVVYIILDSNIRSNPDVLEAARRLGAWMTSKGADVHYIGLPEPPAAPGEKPASLGIDDFRFQNPKAAFADILAIEIPNITDPDLDYRTQVIELEKRFCIIEGQRFAIYDTEFNQVLSEEEFSHRATGHLSYNGKPGSTAGRWLRDRRKRAYKNLILDPGPTPEGFLNLFKGFAVTQPIQGDITWWVTLLAYVIHDQAVRDEIERALLWGFAHPDKWKIFIAIVLIGSNGIGKDLIGKFICNLIGALHSRTITNEQIMLPYDGFLKDTLFLVIEEMATGRSVQNKLKKWISSPRNIINPKCERTLDIPNMVNLFATANETPLYLASDQERRYLVYRSPASAMPTAMIDMLVAKLEDPEALAALLYHAVHSVDYTGFDPRKPAMKTADFYELANEASLSDMDRWVGRNIAGANSGMASLLGGRDIWQASEIAAALPHELEGKGAETALTHSMGSQRFRDDCRSLGLISVHGVKLRLWALRNGPQWAARGNAAIVAEYLRNRPEGFERKPKC